MFLAVKLYCQFAASRPSSNEIKHGLIVSSILFSFSLGENLKFVIHIKYGFEILGHRRMDGNVSQLNRHPQESKRKNSRLISHQKHFSQRKIS